MLKEHPTGFWHLFSPPLAPVGATTEDLASHFEALLYHQYIDTLAILAVVPLYSPLTGQELQTFLNTHYRGAASTGLFLVPSHCLHHLPLPGLDVLVPWL